ncbi:MAG: CAP domain-containing protein [Chitinophagaceae bacterium]
MLYRILSIITILSVLMFSCKKEDLPVTGETIKTGPGNTGGTTPDIVYNVSKSKILQLINNVRQTGCNCGTTVMPAVAVVAWNDKLAKAAYNHSVEMEANDYFSHTGLNGSNAGQRITAAGYTWKTWGENIANGYTTEQAVVSGWLGSVGHCKNIMAANFKEMGVGRQKNYWTQVFGAK